MGVGLQDLYFELIENTIQFINIREQVKLSINRYEPRVTFNDMKISNDDYIESGKITLNISYTIKASNLGDNLRLVIGEN